jgi:hydrogenase maturation protein HypF
VPDPLPSPVPVDGIIGCGGILKSTVTIGRGSSCYLSQYIGTIENTLTYENYDHILRQLLDVLEVKPRLFVCDRHPLAPGMDIAEKTGVPVVRIQHHYAHAVACMAENNISEKCICVVYDGTGYGDDGTTWGGEIFVADYAGYTRVAHLDYMPMPGADAAVHNPGRMAMGALYKNLGDTILTVADWISPEEAESVLSILKSDTNCPLTSGMGRLFDAASALLGICNHGSYEGQPAIMLEGIADLNEQGEMPIHISEKNGVLIIDGGAILQELLVLKRAGTPVSCIAARFHNTISRCTMEIVKKIAEKYQMSTVCLTGGCFQNALLITRSMDMMEHAGLKVATHHLVPPNDGSISYGQVIAGAGLADQR